jgi:hypothetical protein
MPIDVRSAGSASKRLHPTGPSGGPNFTIRIEADRNNDGTFENLVANAAPARNATKSSFADVTFRDPGP